MGFITEFKKFAIKGNVLDLAVGVVIGAAFGKIVTSFVNDILMPPLGLLIGGIDFKGFKVTLREPVIEEGKVVAEAVTFNYGNFIQNITDFLIIAFAIFLMVRIINKMRASEAAKPAPPMSKEEQLLTEIRDLLKENRAK